MTRKRRRHYKLLTPIEAAVLPPRRVEDLTTLGRWAGALFMAGVLVALLLIASLFTSLHPQPSLWLRVWPASLRLMTTPGLSGHQATHLALWLAGKNGLLYALIGILAGGVHVLIRRLFRSIRRRRPA
ncbi:MAG TPA: hypothetical protein VIC54_06655 [Terriglobales bacterium]|jgi:hypothetical protein